MKKVNLLLKRLQWLCAALLILAMLFACVSCGNGSTPDGTTDGDDVNAPPSSTPGDAPQPWASNFNLPDEQEALSRLVDIYGGADKTFLLMSNNIARMPCPQGETVTVNVACDVNQYAKLILEDSLDEFNEVFAEINPNYTFAINYNPTEDDFAQKYSVRLTASDTLSQTDTSKVFGVAHVRYGNGYKELYDFGITIRTEVLNNGSYLATTFKHELMHLLGAGDAYKNASATKATVMQSYTVNGYHSLSTTDVAFLDALYRNPEFAKEDERIATYVEGYEKSCAHKKSNLISATYHKLVSELDAKTVAKQASEIGYKDLTEFLATIGNGIAPDVAFGTANLSFTELEYAEQQAETYFGSIDAQAGTYWHGRQKGLMGNSVGISFVNYGNGILYAAPNGNQYTIMIKTGSFVLTFRLHGGFTNFADLSLALWHVSK